MPGYGPAPKENSRTRHTPQRGTWQSADGVGWQHGEMPKPPAGLLKASRETWSTWMGSWFAAFWTPEDLPGLEVVVLLYDQVRRGEHQRANELRLQMDTYGITPKGQQDRRWKRPEPDAFDESGSERPKRKRSGRRDGALEVIQGGG